jgi:hypothetical protein
MKKITKAALIILVLTLLTSACSNFEPENSQISSSSSTSKSTFTDKSEIVTINLEVKTSMHSNVLNINSLQVDEGVITLRLLTPEGEVIMEQLLVSPTAYDQRFKLDVLPGDWKLELDMEDASGSYDIKWEAKN